MYFFDFTFKIDILKTAPWGCRVCESNQCCGAVVWWFEAYLQVWQCVFVCSVSAALAPTIQAALFCPRWFLLVLVLSHPNILTQMCVSSHSLWPPVQTGCCRSGDVILIKCIYFSFSKLLLLVNIIWCSLKVYEKKWLYLYLMQGNHCKHLKNKFQW